MNYDLGFCKHGSFLKLPNMIKLGVMSKKYWNPQSNPSKEIANV